MSDIWIYIFWIFGIILSLSLIFFCLIVFASPYFDIVMFSTIMSLGLWIKIVIMNNFENHVYTILLSIGLFVNLITLIMLCNFRSYHWRYCLF